MHEGSLLKLGEKEAEAKRKYDELRKEEEAILSDFYRPSGRCTASLTKTIAGKLT